MTDYLEREALTTSSEKEILRKAAAQGWLSGFDFAILMHKMLISEDGYVLGTGNWENVNAAVARLLSQRIQKHPLLWRMLFMVA